MKKDVGFLEAFKLFWTNYFNFRGRSRRSEYWYVALWFVIIHIAFMFVTIISFIINPILGILMGIIWGLFTLGSFIPNLALLVRRFHDVGFPTWVPIGLFIFNFLVGVGTNVVQVVIEKNYTPENFPIGLAIFMMVFGLLSFVLSIFSLVVTILDSKKGTNKYGPNPKAINHYDNRYDGDGYSDNQRDLNDRFHGDASSEKPHENNQDKYHY
ncbi:DUF805 domain-containing protein [Staphylococcus massiliensis]|uniref:DUF805 domain-containing protein n=1 Tax=Staphylococcus massiliensis S46 TaxID=1229783 RepID=K9ASI7_9STAP|nr:DUF805 domain-containing protein [Staphylococcus massiliensis]EKU49026.1 hypothetical protein C273_04455 [Staphylococcus massiliensis S46]PNZ99501.1 DUF805 domain-containing protein [Staphylococcus massiliensis CCUG 55927]